MSGRGVTTNQNSRRRENSKLIILNRLDIKGRAIVASVSDCHPNGMMFVSLSAHEFENV